MKVEFCYKIQQYDIIEGSSRDECEEIFKNRHPTAQEITANYNPDL